VLKCCALCNAAFVLDSALHVTTKIGGGMSPMTCKEAGDCVKRIEVECFESDCPDEISEWFIMNVTESGTCINIY
jgi:hypothetical protein